MSSEGGAEVRTRQQRLAEAEAAGLNPERLSALLTRVDREVAAGLLPAVQIALGRHGRIVFQESFGAADDDSLICIFSATKALTSAAIWLLLQEQLLPCLPRGSDSRNLTPVCLSTARWLAS